MAVRDIVGLLSPWLDYPGVPSKAHPGGRDYRVQSPDRKTGLRLAALAALGRRAAEGESLTAAEVEQIEIGDDQAEDFATMVLGPTHELMLTDGVADMTVQAIARDAFYCFTANEALADLVLQGEAAARDAASKKPAVRSGRKTAGSSSSRASSGTPARTRNRASSRSSGTPAGKAKKTA